MGQDKNQLRKLLAFVKVLYDDSDNREFVAGINALVLNRLAVNTKEDIVKIKNILEIRADLSIDYSFVKDSLVRKQLCIDNLRMENVLLNTSLTEQERYENFCTNAFLQVENILNYYYFEKFGENIDAILKDIEKATQYDLYPFNRIPGKVYHYVSDIPIISKIQGFCNNYMSDKFVAANLHKLRNRRNDIFHRFVGNNVNIRNESDQVKSVCPTVVMYRDALKKVVMEVKNQLS